MAARPALSGWGAERAAGSRDWVAAGSRDWAGGVAAAGERAASERAVRAVGGWRVSTPGGGQMFWDTAAFMDPAGLQEAGQVSADARTHFKVCRFIMEAGVKLGLRSVPVATACTIYHRFFTEVPLEPYDPYLVAMAALYLAGKVEEQHLRTRDIINVSHRYLHPRSDPLELDTHFWELRDSIVQCELLMLRVLCFRVSFQHPHKYLLHYLLSLKHWMNRHSWDRTPVAVAAWALLRDSYHGPLCLQHSPQHIAVTVLYLALQCYGVEVPADAEAERPWWQVFSEDLSKSILDQIVLDLIRIYTLDAEVS